MHITSSAVKASDMYLNKMKIESLHSSSYNTFWKLLMSGKNIKYFQNA